MLSLVPDDEDENSMYAADDPTAMWDESALAALGLDVPPEEAASKQTPATASQGGSESIQVASPELAPPAAASPPQAAPAKAGLSWPITIGLAVALAVGVYFLVRFLR